MQVAAADPSSAKPVLKRFRKRHDVVRLSPEQAQRQGRIAGVAWAALDGRDAVVAFLNTHDEAIAGRPIDVAVASDAGFAIVERALAARAVSATGAAASPPSHD